jgi:hypothetical protein
MQIADMMKTEGRVLLKSEWGQISDYWPCVSFTKRSAGERLRANYIPGRDVLVYVGTRDGDLTKNSDHRSALISAVTIDPSQVLATRDIVPEASWKESTAKWGDRWPFSMPVTFAASVVGPPYPSAYNLIPKAYRSFASPTNRGNVVEALAAERDAVMRVEVEPVTLSLREGVARFMGLRSAIKDTDTLIRQQASRMAELIIQRVRAGGEVSVRINPQRYAPNYSDLYALLVRKLNEQRGRCALCQGAMVLDRKLGMLRPSADRIDSGNGAYNDENVWITHLACNLAKNKYGLDEFEEWVDLIRSSVAAAEEVSGIGGSSDDLRVCYSADDYADDRI